MDYITGMYSAGLYGEICSGEARKGLSRKLFYGVALVVANKLKEQGQVVLLPRSTDCLVSLAERINMANAAGADMFVSLHRNAFSNSTAKALRYVFKF